MLVFISASYLGLQQLIEAEKMCGRLCSGLGEMDLEFNDHNYNFIFTGELFSPFKSKLYHPYALGTRRLNETHFSNIDNIYSRGKSYIVNFIVILFDTSK